MKIVPFDNESWKKDHPTGNIAFQHMLKGDPASADNFMYVLARQDGDFAMPRHRHNFDQIRLPIRGDMNIGRGVTLREGEIGYFVEGIPYGPQEDPLGNAAPGERLQLVLQFGGASTYGFMSIEQRRQAWAELAEKGKFVGPNYQTADGKTEWGLNAIWRHVFGGRLKYPAPRYKNVVIADPKNFTWMKLSGADGVAHKFMGSFSERGVWVEMIRLEAGARWSSLDPRARRLFVVLKGMGQVAGQKVEYMSSLQIDAGESLSLTADSPMELFLIGLPPLETPVEESDRFDLEELLPEDETA